MGELKNKSNHKLQWMLANARTIELGRYNFRNKCA